tara:strand:- start:135 stop:347 length:213 start_codon:yes stop_codon:yes gene_type:complete
MKLETALLIKEYRKFYGLDTNREAAKMIRKAMKSLIENDECKYHPHLILDADENTDKIDGLCSSCRKGTL